MLNNLQREAWYIGNLAGVPIFLHWSAFVLVLMVWGGSSGGGVEYILLVLIALIVAVILHELGHGLMAKALGAHGITITLWAFGGLCSSRRDSERIGREIAIVAAGPAVSLALWLGSGIAFEQLRIHSPGVLVGPQGLSLLGQGLLISEMVNKSLFIFNMMPIFPMDGGQLIYYSAIAVTRNQTLARQISLFLAVFGSLAFFMWRTGLMDILRNGGNAGQWVGSLGFADVFLAVLLGMMVRSAFAYLR